MATGGFVPQFPNLQRRTAALGEVATREELVAARRPLANRAPRHTDAECQSGHSPATTRRSTHRLATRPARRPRPPPSAVGFYCSAPMEGGEEEVHHEEGEGVYGLSDQELLVYSSNLRYVNIPFVIAAFL